MAAILDSRFMLLFKAVKTIKGRPPRRIGINRNLGGIGARGKTTFPLCPHTNVILFLRTMEFSLHDKSER